VLKVHKIRFRPGRPLGKPITLPQFLIGGGGDKPSPFSTPLNMCSISSSATHCLTTACIIPWSHRFRGRCFAMCQGTLPQGKGKREERILTPLSNTFCGLGSNRGLLGELIVLPDCQLDQGLARNETKEEIEEWESKRGREKERDGIDYIPPFCLYSIPSVL